MKEKTEAFSRGFDAGNYGNAYESQDWDSFWAEESTETPEGLNPTEYAAGCLLGFFSSYEVHEISDDVTAEEVAALRAEYGEEA